MIELLIVIAVLGILAVAVLSVINPIEQINRSRDTGGRSDSEQLIGAIDRYYANNGLYVWQATSESDAEMPWTEVDLALLDDGGTIVLNKLDDTAVTGTNEIKASFVSRITAPTYKSLYVYNNGTAGSSTYVCFEAQSKQFQTDALARCNEDAKFGALPLDFPADACIADAVSGKVKSCLP